MQKNSPKDYAVALFEVTKNIDKSDLKNVLEQFTLILFREGKIKQVDEIIAEFIKHNKQQAGEIDIEITSARPLTAKLVSEIKKAFGTKVGATEKINPELIGGIKVKTENKIFDASLQKQLKLLKQSLI